MRREPMVAGPDAGPDLPATMPRDLILIGATVLLVLGFLAVALGVR